ncbi:MAG: 50S ribosomal protein L31 [Alphaproteobacteria bacterium]|nr:50S ribosomal protein L31 [Alphaproteobacteria bacterium]
MRADIHPDYHEINIVLTDGTTYKSRSCTGKAGDTIRLDIDPLNHPAWQGGTQKVIEKAQLKKFNNKYGNLFGSEEKK